MSSPVSTPPTAYPIIGPDARLDLPMAVVPPGDESRRLEIDTMPHDLTGRS